MTARVITITSGKGGVGKTTTVANLGVALARAGQRVVIIDTDIGLRNLDVVLGLQNRIVYDVVDLAEGRCRPRQALIRDRLVPELYLLQAAQSRDKTAVSPQDVRRICEQLLQDCQFILIDSPAGIEQGFRNAIAPANEFILVTTPDYAALQDVDRVLGILEGEGRSNVHLIINRMRPDLARRGDSLTAAQVIDVLAIELLGIVPESEDVLAANIHGVPIAHQPETLAGRAYRNIARRLLGQEVPFISLLEAKPTFWQRIGLARRPSSQETL